MSDTPELRDTLRHLVSDLRDTLHELGQDASEQTHVVSDARDRLRYIAGLTEQAASQTLGASEAISDRLHGQLDGLQALLRRARSPAVRDYLSRLQSEHAASLGELSEIIQAQAFQDLVGQLVNKLLITLERLESNLAHLLVETDAEPEHLAGPQAAGGARVSQDDIDALFD